MTTYDASSISNWSGVPHYVARALLRQGVQLDHVGPLQTSISRFTRARARIHRRGGRRYLIDCDPRVLNAYARQVASRLAHLDVDAVFSPGTIPIALLDTRLPVVYWTDATFAAMVDYYPSFSGLCGASIRAGNRMERWAIERSAAAVYASAWAAESALRAYAADPAKVHVLPFGANLESEPSRGCVARLIEKRPRRECKLLFVGVDWRRKGGNLALAVVSKLVERGVPARLTVVGCRAADVPDSQLVDYLGFIDKSTPSGEATMVRLLGESHFLCVPSRAECFGIVFCEASAYGVPSLSIRTGGIPSAVGQARNGYLFEEGSFVDSAVDVIATCMASYDSVYVPLALSSHDEYHSRLNWTTSTRMLVERISNVVAGRT